MFILYSNETSPPQEKFNLIFVARRSGPRRSDQAVCATKSFLPMMLAIGCCLFLSLSPGCGGDEGEGVAPSISNLFLGPVSAIVLEQGGLLGVTVSMDYADPDGDIAFVRMRFRFCGEGEVQYVDIAPGGITGNQAGAIWISARDPDRLPCRNLCCMNSRCSTKRDINRTPSRQPFTLTTLLGTGQ